MNTVNSVTLGTVAVGTLNVWVSVNTVNSVTLGTVAVGALIV